VPAKTWLCAQCRTYNKADACQCVVCDEHRPATASKSWKCAECGTANDSCDDVCLVCAGERPTHPAPAPVKPKPEPIPPKPKPFKPTKPAPEPIPTPTPTLKLPLRTPPPTVTSTRAPAPTPSKAALDWQCGICRTSNRADCADCVVCGAVRGSTGATEELFYGTPGIPSTPSFTPKSEARSRLALKALLSIAAVVAVLGGALFIADHGGSSSSAAPAPTSSTDAASATCPDRIAEKIPQGTGARLVQAFVTSNKEIVLCRTEGGQLYYFGDFTDDPNSSIVIPARSSAGGFTADNGPYRYVIADGYVTIYQNGNQIGREQLTRETPN
jgi:hypothetical protein